MYLFINLVYTKFKSLSYCHFEGSSSLTGWSSVDAGCDRQLSDWLWLQWCKYDSSAILSVVTWGFDLLSPWWPLWCHHVYTHSLLSSSSSGSLSVCQIHLGLLASQSIEGERQNVSVWVSDGFYHKMIDFTWRLLLVPTLSLFVAPQHWLR